jgi:hypothetical protein
MTNTPNKEYKKFAFPNKLSGLETFYYYLKEFGIIPDTIDNKIAEKLFTAAATDYLEGNLPAGYLALIASNLAFKMVDEDRLTPGLYQLLEYTAELDHDYVEEEEAIKKLLKIYTDDPKKLAELYSSGDMNKVFIS